MGIPTAQIPAFLSDGGEMGALMRAHDWRQSPLGAPASWPRSLCTVVGLMLSSRFPMFLAWGPELGFLYNDAYVDILGGKHPNALGRRFQEVWPEIWEKIHPIVADAMAGKPVYHRDWPLVLKRNGYDEQAWFTFSYSPLRDESGRVAGMFCTCTETTGQVAAERRRVEELERLRQLANTIPQLAWMAEPDGHVRWYNDRWTEYTGLSGAQSQGDGWQAAIHPDDLPALLVQWKTALASGRGYEAAARMRAADGSYRAFIVRAAPLRDPAGRIVQWFGTDTDVSPIEAAQRELQEANRRKDEFLAMLAHELRNPLAPIVAATDLLSMATLDADKVQQASKLIARQVEHMSKLVDDLQDVSRVTRGLVKLDDEILNVNDLLGSAVEQVQSQMQAKRHRFIRHAPDEQLFVRGDRIRLIQAFSNILHNAAKFTPPEGCIALRLGGSETQVEVAIEDDGIGIEPALLPHVFELFAQGKRSPDRSQGGLGLGLALARSLLELQGGSVAAHSDGAGRGSRFVVHLPRIAAPCARCEGAGENRAAPPAVPQQRLMVVDDNRDAALTLSLLLETTGHKVSVSYSAEDALETARRIAPAVMFLDIGLPDMEGYELARQLRRLPETANCILVAVTGHGRPENKEKARQAGFDHHFVKPVKLGAVLALLATIER